MTKGQLIVECLKLLNENNGEKIDDTIVSSLPEYSERTSVIVPSINRALHRLSELKKLPVENYEIKYSNTVRGNITVPVEITKNILRISNVLLEDEYNNIETNVSYFVDGEIMILPELYNRQKYTIIYEPVVKELTDNDDDLEEIQYPKYVTQCIPYFVKADLFEEDSPELANLARNIFESYASQIPTKNKSVLRGVKDVYGLY